MDLEQQVGALDDGRGYVDLSGDRLLRVDGDDAERWLGDLVTASTSSLDVGGAQRSLLLTPTGRIRADFLLSKLDDGAFLAVQARDQEEAVAGVLAPYVLSSAVALTDVDRLHPRWFPGPERLTVSLDPPNENAVPVAAEPFERWRVRRGDPRMGVDFDAGSLPAESRLEDAIDFQKGCYLGQESVAKVANRGHPPTVLLHLRSDAALVPGTVVHTPDHPVGAVTSIVPGVPAGWVLLARVVWAAAGTDLYAEGGTPLVPVED